MAPTATPRVLRATALRRSTLPLPLLAVVLLAVVLLALGPLAAAPSTAQTDAPAQSMEPAPAEAPAQTEETPAPSTEVTLPGPGASPEEVTRAYLNAVREHGLASSVAFFHPEELVRFKEMLMPVVEVDMEQAQGQFTRTLYGEGVTLEQVQAMDAGRFVRGLMDFITSQTEAFGGLQFGELAILGSVPEGEDRIHVVTRLTVGVQDFQMTQMEVVSLLRKGETWRLLLTGELEGMARALQRQMSG